MFVRVGFVCAFHKWECAHDMGSKWARVWFVGRCPWL